MVSDKLFQMVLGFNLPIAVSLLPTNLRDRFSTAARSFSGFLNFESSLFKLGAHFNQKRTKFMKKQQKWFVSDLP